MKGVSVNWVQNKEIHFKISEEFIEQFKGKQPNWGPVGYVTYKRTYSRVLADGSSEEYWQTVRRVVETTFTMQKRWLHHIGSQWSEEKKQEQAKEMFRRMWAFKFTPPGRGLWAMSVDVLEKKMGAVLNNCAFVSTAHIKEDFAEPFTFLMDMSMLGVGVGGDTKGAGTLIVQQPQETCTFVVEDSREGWVDLTRNVLNAYAGKCPLPKEVDYSQVRPMGAPLHGLGGVASGPGPLKDLHQNLITLLDKRVGQPITSSDIVDIFNLIGRCVVSGGIRRTAEIMFGAPDDKEFMELKDPEKNREALEHHRWASNNSIFAQVGMDYSEVAQRTAKNGEPGYEWLGNAQKFSRMRFDPDNKDHRAGGGNPCLEQTLEPYELCCLVETYPGNHESLEDWHKTLFYAFMYAKTVSLIPTHYARTNQIILRNRRIGCSMSGITQAFTKFGRRHFLNMCDKGYDKLTAIDKEISEEFAIGMSIKRTSVKPSGTVSLLAGVTPGIHYPTAQYYIRNIRFQEGSPLLEELRKRGYKIEKDVYSLQTYVVSFPVQEKLFDRAASDVSMWEQLENTAQIQSHWADNQVSVTITFKAQEAGQIKHALELYESRLKGVSFLPAKDHGYKQAPYIPITKEEYERLKAEIINDINQVGEMHMNAHDSEEKFCDGDACQIDPTAGNQQ